MFRGQIIRTVVDLLQRRRVLLYHACQYKDFISYLTVGGIPSRAHLEQESAQFTAFETDAVDHTNDVWDKVFVNFSDFGKTFAGNGPAVPNPYGPILFRIRPAALVEANDVAICLRSAGAAGFSRERESLQTVEDVDRIFARPQDDSYPGTTWIKFAPALQEEFSLRTARDPEVSCTFSEGVLPLHYVQSLLVDPYTIGNHSLRTHARAELERRRLEISVEARSIALRQRYDELARLVREQTPTLAEIGSLSNRDQTIRWAARARERNLDYQFKRYGDYLREGTLEPLYGALP